MIQSRQELEFPLKRDSLGTMSFFENTGKEENMRKIVIFLVALIAFPFVETAKVKAATLSIGIKNLTNGQVFSRPIYAVGPCLPEYSPLKSDDTNSIFAIGRTASVSLEMMAEGGVTTSITNWLRNKGWNVVIGPETISRHNHYQEAHVPVPLISPTQKLCVTVILKLLQTNDAFIAFQNVEVAGTTTTTKILYPEVFDAGTEKNDELCVSIPSGGWSPCGSIIGQGFNPYRWPGERYVTLHTGIAGFGNLKPMDVGFNPMKSVLISFCLNS